MANKALSLAPGKFLLSKKAGCTFSVVQVPLKVNQQAGSFG